MIILQTRDDALMSSHNFLFLLSDDNGTFWYGDHGDRHAAKGWAKCNCSIIYGSLIKSGEPNE